VESLEAVQRRAVRFVKNLKGRESVTDARLELGLPTLEERRRNHRLSLLMRILQDEERHNVLSSSYDEIMNGREAATMTTRAASRGEPVSIFASTKAYYDSFLPRTIRDLKIGPNHNHNIINNE